MHTESAEQKFFTKPLLIIFLTIFLDLLGFGMVIPLLPFFAQDFQATPLEIGLLVSVYSWMQFFFAPILGSLSDRTGRRPVLFFSIIGSGIGYLMIGLAGSLAMMFAGRVLGGITGANLSTAQAYIADVTTRENRAKGMGLFGMAFGLGFIMGPAIAGILSKWGHEIPFFVAAGLSFLNAGLLYFILPESLKPGAPVRERKGRLRELFESVRDSRFASLTLQYFLLVMAFSMMNTAFPLYTGFSFGYDAEHTGYVLAYVGLLAVIMQGYLLDKLSKRFGLTRLVIAGVFILLVSFLAVPYVSAQSFGLIGLLIGAAGFAIGNGLSSPSLTALASKVAHEHEQGKALGVMQSAASLARAVSPMLTGYLLNNAVNQVDADSLKRNFWTAAAILLVTLFVAVYFMTHNEEKSLNA
ncbi:MAG: MFS transporter [Acidobacteria bacterium]|nr:MFS transporter [Acidobacteriota bacterium]